MNIRNTLAGLGLITALTFPCLVIADELDSRLELLKTHLKSCTQKHGYNPDRTGRYGDHEIAPGEIKWRDCAYEGIRLIMVPSSAVPNSYQNLIALDKVMTREIQAGELSRADRKKRIDKFVDLTLSKEKKAPSKTAPQGDATQQAELQQMRKELVTRMNEIQRMRSLQIR
jgi:hypothetical protein